jgi:hypothetical protein
MTLAAAWLIGPSEWRAARDLPANDEELRSALEVASAAVRGFQGVGWPSLAEQGTPTAE